MILVFKEEYECKIYIDTDEEISTLLQNIVTLFNSKYPQSNCVSVYDGDILISENKKFNVIDKKSPEDGFLFYRYILKVKPNRALGKDNAVKLVSKVLEDFWAKGYPAIAACEYESELPNKGGYKSQNIPKSV